MNTKKSAPMQSQTNDMITEFGPHDLRLRSSPRGDLHYIEIPGLEAETSLHARFYSSPKTLQISHNVHTQTTTSSVGPHVLPPSSARLCYLSLGFTTDVTPLGITPSLTTYSS